MTSSSANYDIAFYEMSAHLSSLSPSSKLSKINKLELSGVLALLHNYYNGIENIIKQAILAKNVTIPQGQSWHHNLLLSANEHKTFLRKHKLTWPSTQR